MSAPLSCLNSIRREVHHRFVNDDGAQSLVSTGFHMGLPELQTSKKDAFQPEYSISYILRGEGWFSDDCGTRYPFRPGSVVQRYPNRNYDIYRDEDFVHLEFFLILPRALHDGFLSTGLTRKEPSVFEVGIDSVFVNRLLDFVHRFATSSDSEVRRVLMETLALVIEFYKRDLTLDPDSGENRVVDQACLLLRSEFESKLSLREIAAKIGLSYESFRKKFRDVKGISPSQYRIQKRLEAAMELLIEDRLSIKEIAHRLGYANPAHFTKLFQKAYQQPPAAFRAAHRRRAERNR